MASEGSIRMSTPTLGPPVVPTGQYPASTPRATSIEDYVRMGSPRNALFLLLVAVSLFIFWTPLRGLLHYSLLGDNQYDQYSYTLAIPFISMAVVFVERH